MILSPRPDTDYQISCAYMGSHVGTETEYGRRRKYLDTTKIDLGSGPRALVEGGKLHPTQRIYVPEALVFRRSASADGAA